jgi:hypothetical protein
MADAKGAHVHVHCPEDSDSKSIVAVNQRAMQNSHLKSIVRLFTVLVKTRIDGLAWLAIVNCKLCISIVFCVLNCGTRKTDNGDLNLVLVLCSALLSWETLLWICYRYGINIMPISISGTVWRGSNFDFDDRPSRREAACKLQMGKIFVLSCRVVAASRFFANFAPKIRLRLLPLFFVCCFFA